MPISKTKLFFSWKMLLFYGIIVICIITDKHRLLQSFRDAHKHKVNAYKNSKNPTREVPAQYSNKASSKAQKVCPKKHFKTFHMKNCLKWLECDEIERMVMVAKKYETLGAGVTKQVRKKHFKIVVKSLFAKDCHSSLK